MFSSACFGHPSFPKCNNPSWRLQCSFSSHMKGVSLWARPSFTNSINKCCAHGRNKYCNSSLTKAQFPDVYNIMVFKVVILLCFTIHVLLWVIIQLAPRRSFSLFLALSLFLSCSQGIVVRLAKKYWTSILEQHSNTFAHVVSRQEILNLHFGTTLRQFC